MFFSSSVLFVWISFLRSCISLFFANILFLISLNSASFLLSFSFCFVSILSIFTFMSVRFSFISLLSLFISLMSSRISFNNVAIDFSSSSFFFCSFLALVRALSLAHLWAAYFLASLSSNNIHFVFTESTGGGGESLFLFDNPLDFRQFFSGESCLSFGILFSDTLRPH